MQPRSTLDITRDVLDLIKSEIITGDDIISRKENPFFFIFDHDERIKKYGEDRVNRFMDNATQLTHVRNEAKKLFPSLKEKCLPSPVTTLNIAITMCGVGAGNEIANRAFIELIRAGCQEPIRYIFTSGKIRNHAPKDLNDYYNHIFIIIGQVPDQWNQQKSISAFKLLNDQCILFDPMLGITGQANNTEFLLEHLFSPYGINKIHTDLTTTSYPSSEKKAECEIILKNAKEISDVIKLKLGMTRANPNPDEKNRITSPNASDINFLYIDYPSTSDDYVIRLQKILGDHNGKNIVNRSASGTRVSFPRFWVKQLSESAKEELSENLNCPKSLFK